MPQKEREWMERFFKYILLDEGAIFTLWGSKPMTEIIIYEYDDEIVQNYINSLSQEELDQCRIRENYDLPELWAKWKEYESKPSFNRYLLVERKDQQDKDVRFVYFVDILKTACTIQDNYDLFKDAVGYDFSPLEAVLELNDDHPPFWESIQGKRKAHLWGLLFGFGKENALAFQWKHFDKGDKSDKFFQTIRADCLQEFDPKITKITLQNFELPCYISFDEEDPIFTQYEKEQEQIKQIYKGKNFLDATLKRLTRQ